MNYLLRDIPPGLWREFKKHAADRGKSLRSLIIELIDEYLERERIRGDNKDNDN